MKNSLLFIIFLLFSGCMFKQETIDINHYAISFKTQQIASNNKFQTIYIEDTKVNKSFDLNSIFYTTKPYLFEAYAKNRWISLPSTMIHNQIIDSFNSSNLFANTISKDKKLAFDYLLKSEVLQMYQVFEDDKSYAVLKIKFDLIKNYQIVKSFDFDKKIACDENSAYGFVKAINIGFEEILNSLLRDL